MPAPLDTHAGEHLGDAMTFLKLALTEVDDTVRLGLLRGVKEVMDYVIHIESKE